MFLFALPDIHARTARLYAHPDQIFRGNLLFLTYHGRILREPPRYDRKHTVWCSSWRGPRRGHNIRMGLSVGV